MKNFDGMGSLFTRRRFLGAIASTGALAGCRAFSPAGGDRPLLRIGVVSDVHFRLVKDGDRLEDGYGAETFEKALEYYRDMGVDAVVVAGEDARVEDGRVRQDTVRRAAGAETGLPGRDGRGA